MQKVPLYLWLIRKTQAKLEPFIEIRMFHSIHQSDNANSADKIYVVSLR